MASATGAQRGEANEEDKAGGNGVDNKTTTTTTTTKGATKQATYRDHPRAMM